MLLIKVLDSTLNSKPSDEWMVDFRLTNIQNKNVKKKYFRLVL